MKPLTNEELEHAAREIRRGIKPSIIAASLRMTVSEMTEALTAFASQQKGSSNVTKILTDHDKPKIERIAGFEIERNAPPLSASMPVGYIGQLVSQLNVGDVVHGLRGGTRYSIGKALREKGLNAIARSYEGEGGKTLWRLQVISK